MSAAKDANGIMQVKDGSYTKNCLEVETQSLINSPTSYTQKTLAENAQQHSSSQDELLKSPKKHRRIPHKFEELKIEIGAFPGVSQEAKMQDNILAKDDQNLNFQQNGDPSEKTKNVGPSEKMEKNLRIKGQGPMSETEVCSTRHTKISRPEGHHNEVLACEVQPTLNLRKNERTTLFLWRPSATYALSVWAAIIAVLMAMAPLSSATI